MRKIVCIILGVLFFSSAFADADHKLSPSGPVNLCPGGSVTFSANNIPANPSYQWILDNNPINGATGTTYTANAAGNYSLVITSNGTPIYYDTVTVVMNSNPTADFTFNNNNSCSGTAIQFTSTVTSGVAPFTYAWTFGGGGTSTLANPTHSFTSLGCGTANFTVTLVVTDANGCSVTITKTNAVTVIQAPDVQVADQNVFFPFNNCSNNPTPSNPNYTITIGNASPSAACITSYSINWGDGVIQNNITFPISHTYTELGAFNLVVSAIGTNGCVGSRTYVVANQNNPAGSLGTLGSTTGLCAPAVVPFTISNWQLNSPGTTYVLDFGDGNSRTLTHPLNPGMTTDTIYHTYTESSCPASTYTATLNVINGCATTPYTAGNIQVRIRPTAGFTAPANGCVNQSICFTNTTTQGFFGANCSTTTLYNWDFGDGSPTSSAANPCHTYTTPGTYTVTLTTSNPCGSSTITRQICITAVPVPSFTVDNTTACAPITVNTTNTSNTLASCVPATYVWSVSNYTPTNCGTTSGFSFANGTTSSSLSPSFTFTNPGTYTIRLAITNPCGTVNSTQNIIVKAPPSVNLPAFANACAPVTITPNPTITNCGTTPLTYQWSFPGGSPTSSNTASPGSVTYATPGAYSVTLAATNECGTTTVVRPLQVNSRPDITVPSNLMLCPGDATGALTFTSALAGTTFSWQNNNTSIGLGGSGNGNIPNFNVVNNTGSAITATINVTATNGGCTNQASFTITVNPRPSAPVVTTPVTYCQNVAATPLTATSTAGHSLLWYTTSTGGVGSATAPTPSTTTVGTTNYYVSQVNTTTNCESNRSLIAVTINESPVIGTATPTNPTSCNSSTGSILLTGLTPNTSYNVSYVRNGGAPTNITRTSTATGNINIEFLQSGTYTSITVARNGCSSNIMGPVVLSDPNPPATPTITTNATSPLCSGATLTLSASTASGAATYNWGGPGGFSSSQQNPTRTNVTTVASGTYTVTATISGCTSAAGTVDVVINPSPATPTVGSNTPVCTGNTLNLTANSTAGATYEWGGPNGYTSTDQNPTRANAASTFAGTYTVTATLGTCTATNQTSVVVNPTPVIGGSTFTNPTNCGSSTGTIVLTGLTAGASYTVSFVRDGGAPTVRNNIVANGSGELTITGLAAGSYTNIFVSLTGCNSAPLAGPINLVDPTPPALPTITHNGPQCSGNTLTLEANTTSGAATYIWNGPNGFTSTLANPTIPNVTTAATGNYTVTATINGCTSPTAQVNITINPTPAIPTVSSNSPVCTGNTLSLNSNSTTGGVSYSWTGPNGFISAVQNPTRANVVTADAGNYIVTATLGSCSSQNTTAVVINPTPVIGGSTSTNPTNCATATGTITLTGLTANATYNVSYVRDGGAPTVLSNVTANASGEIVITSLSAGAYTNIFVTLNGCNSTPLTGTITLSDPTPPATPTIIHNAPICSGNTLTLEASTTSPGSATFAWGGPNGFTANTANPTIANVTTAATGTYTVTATINGCTSSAASVNITINPTPTTPTAGSNSPVCSGNTLNLNAASTTAGVTYSWTGPNTFASALQNPTRSNVVAADAGTYIVTATLGSCSSQNTTAVVVNPTPVIGGSTSTNPTNCATATGTITLTGLTANATYNVSYVRDGGAPTVLSNVTANASGEIVITSLSAGAYTNIFVTLNGCNSPVLAGTITLSDPTPPATPTIIHNAPICSGNTLTLEASTTSPGSATFAWGGPNGFTANTANPTIANVTTAATGTYTVTATINGCTSSAASVNITINPTPTTPTAGSNSPVCSGNTLNLNAASTTPGVAYAWSGPNTFASTLQNPTRTNVTTADAGVYTVIATLGSCSSDNTTTVVINPTPVIGGSTSTNPTNCATATGTITLTGLTANATYNVSYVRDGGAPTVLSNVTANASGEIVITSLSAGAYTNIFVTLNGCNSPVLAGTITLSDPTPPATPVVTSNAPICSGNTLELFATSASTGTITYTWSGPNNFTSITQNPTIPSTTLAANGTYNVTATLNSCVSPAGTINVVINETPATPVANNNGPICADSTLNLTASTTFAGAVSWSWTGPNTFASSSQNPSIANATLAANGTYNVIATATTGNCPSAAGTTNVVINPTPVISSSSFTNPILCLSSTGTIVLNGLAPSTAYTVTYTRNTAPVTATITSEGTGSLIIPLLSAGTYENVSVSTLAGCPSNTVGPFVLVDPNPPAAPTASSNSPICTGETLQLNASTTTTGAITYSWSGPAGFSSTVQNPTIINATPANSGTYSVTATLNNCVSPATSVLVEVTALPSPPTVISPINYCIDAPSVPLTATTVPGNSLRWYTQAVGGVASATAPTPTTNVTGVTTYYVSQATALGCEGTRAAIDVIVNPDALAEYVSSPSIDCAPFNINASVLQPILHPTRNNVYNWYANDVLIGSGTTFPGYTILHPGDSIFIKLVTTSLFGCRSDSAARWFYTFPVPVTDFTASDTVGCGPLSVTFTNTTPNPGSFSFNWNFGNGVTSTAVNPGTIVFQPNPTAGDTTYNVTLAAFTQCDTIIKVVPIRVKSKPQAIFTPDKTYGCSPLTVVFNNISLGLNMTFEWNFGDGSPSFFTNNTSPVSHTYNTAQQDTFHVRLIATNDCGSDTGYYNIVVAARTINLDVAVNGNQVTGCAPHAVRFFNNSTGATNFIWDLGDGNIRTTTRNIDTLDHTYLTTGTFTVTISASNGCTDTTITETISVFAKPLVNFTALPSPVCIGDTVYFTNQTDTFTGLLWNFGDLITSQLTNPVHAYQTPGTYDVKLIGIRQYGPGNACTDSITKQITVVATLPGSFDVSATVGNCIPFTVTFTNQTQPSALTTWNFGNGAVDTGDVVSYTFTQGGVFAVTMTVRHPNGCTYTATRNITINGPAGSFIYDNGYICGNTPVRFEANTTGTDSIRWNFGDGTILTSTASIVYHVYNQPGVYVPTATLLAGIGGSCSRLLTGADTIRVDYVSAGFTSTQLRLCGSTTVNFNDTSRSYFPMQSWQWSFGDGNNSGVRHPNHTYTSTNTWPIQLISTSTSGCADTTIVALFVKVDVKPEASIVHNPVGCVNQPVTYNSVVISPDPITYYSWTFSNLASGNTATVTNNYAAPGIYTAQLITGTSFGCYDTVTSPITINPSPFVNTSVDMVLCRGESAQLNTTGGLTYTWSPFTGLSCNDCPNPIASPVTTTQYVVTGFNSFGCAARDTILITVPQPIDVNVVANTVMCIGDTVQLNATGAVSYIWSPANTLNNANIPNPIATPPATTIYRVIGFDGYNCFEDTAYVTVGVGNYPVVNVGIDRLVATGELINLTPTATNGPIAVWNWTPPTDLSCATCPSPIATAKKEICYTVTATNFFGCSGSDTMCIRVFCESSQVFIPNAFTPDGDGINDVLVVKAQGVKAVKSFRVFNRWGQLVFEKSNFPPNVESFGWDGKVKGVAAPPDVYVYTCEVLCENDVPYTYKGNTAILK